jgi:metal-responsive CopG/Arc/MetJ family transcriptional regulator
MNIMTHMKTKPVTMSLQEKTLKQLDQQRGDVTRSRFVQRILDKVLSEQPVRPKAGEGGYGCA